MPSQALYALTVLIWGSTWYVLTFQIGPVAPEWSVAIRFALAALIILSAAGVMRQWRRLSSQNLLGVATQGVLAFAICYGLTYAATGHVTSGLIAVANSTASIFTIVFGAVLFGQPFRPRVAIGALVGISGLALIFWPEIRSAPIGGHQAWALGITVLSTIAVSLSALLGQRNQKAGVPIVFGTGLAMAFGSAAIAVYAAGFGLPIDLASVAPSYWTSLAYLTIFGSVVAFLSFYTLVARIGADKASYAAILFPVLAMALSTLLEGYVWTLEAAVGAILVGSGNVIALTRLGVPFRRRLRPAGA